MRNFIQEACQVGATPVPAPLPFTLPIMGLPRPHALLIVHVPHSCALPTGVLFCSGPGPGEFFQWGVSSTSEATRQLGPAQRVPWPKSYQCQRRSGTM